MWPESAEETRIIDAVVPDAARLRAGDGDETFRLLVLAMYRDLDRHGPAADVWPALRDAPPSTARQVLLARHDEHCDIARRARAMPSVISSEDATSREVAGQYDAAPYPRWSSVLTYGEGAFIERMAEVFPRRELTFADKPFEVLVAGCGTGRQAISGAIDFGPKAHVTGIDITRTSLGYAQRMTERFGVENIDLLRADIETLPHDAPQMRNRFQIVECVGVLHHMQRPLAGWRALKACLAPGGIMMIGLYSRQARTGLAALRARPDYPGPGCSDAALRQFRETVRRLPDGAPGTQFRKSADFYTASGFRDLLLHVHENTFTLEEIAAFLAAEELVFRGFFNVPPEVLRHRFPTQTGPGTLDAWAALEREQPNLFGSMYQFWCTPKVSAAGNGA
ncbi:MAG: class I SAM-dependent methyltransferase [Hyphomicrobiaceae bacterium]